MLKRRVINLLFLILGIVLVALDFFASVPWWIYGAIGIAWFLITLSGSFFIRWNYHLKSISSNKEIDENWVSITFDDGPNAGFTPKVLNLLKNYGAKATFFCIGQLAEKNPKILKQIISDGHSVGNHTYSHSRLFGFYGSEKVKVELQKTTLAIKKITTHEMNLYRPAFGVTNPNIEKAVRNLGLKSIGWNVRSLDTTHRSENMIFNRITKKLNRGDIILLHDTSEKSVAVLERLLVFLNENNLQSVTVESLLKIKAYG